MNANLGYILTAIVSGMAGWFLCSATHKRTPQEVVNNSQAEVNNSGEIPPTRKYTEKSGKYYEYVWDGESYGSAIEITEDEYDFLTNKQMSNL